MDGIEKLRGQLRDAAEGGQREEDVSDRAHGAAARGTRLALDQLGRLTQKKKRGKGQSTDSLSEPTPTASVKTEPPTISRGAEPSAPPGKLKSAAPTTERVKIKTREAVHDIPTEMYGGESSAARPASAKPSVKTKDTYIHRRTETRSEIGQAVSTSSPRMAEHSAPHSTNLPQNTRQAIKTKEKFVRRQAVGQGGAKSDTSLMSESQPFSTQPEAPQPMERDKQKFIREQEQKAVEQRAQGGRIESPALSPSDQRKTIEAALVPSEQTPPDAARRTENHTLSKKKIAKDDATGGKFRVKEARSKLPGIKRPARKSVKAAADSPRQSRQRNILAKRHSRQPMLSGRPPVLPSRLPVSPFRPHVGLCRPLVRQNERLRL